MNKSILIRILLGVVAAILVFLEIFGFQWTRTDLFQDCQSLNVGVRYVPYETYCFSIVRRGKTFSSDYVVKVTERNRPDYGYGFQYPSWNGFTEAGLSSTKVEWLPEGVAFSIDENVKITIPKEKFVGGR